MMVYYSKLDNAICKAFVELKLKKKKKKKKEFVEQETTAPKDMK